MVKNIIEVAVPVRINRDSILNKTARQRFKHYKVKQTNKKPRPIRKEAMALQYELHSINEQLRVLKKRKEAIKRELSSRGQPIVRSSYFEKEIILYVLKLEHNCWYIGQSRNVEARVRKHKAGKGAAWTKAHKPLELHEVRRTGLNNDSEVAQLEDELTFDYARMYGYDNVRGGGYCQTKPRWPEHVIMPIIEP